MKGISLITICLVLSPSLIISIAKDRCPIIECSSSNRDDNVCAQLETNGSEGNTIKLNECKDDYQCLTGSAVFANNVLNLAVSHSCTKVPSFVDNAVDTITSIGSDIVDAVSGAVDEVNKVDEEECDKDANCASLKCTDSKCVGLDDGAVCATDYQCKVGSTCYLLKCAKQAKAGEACAIDLNCENNMVCNNLKCAEEYSLANGESATNAKACQSATVNVLAVPPQCDKRTLKTEKCGDGEDECTYTWEVAGDVPLAGGCICNNDNSRSRSCTDVQPSKVNYKTGVHTTKRIEVDVDSDDEANLDSIKETYGTCAYDVLNYGNASYIYTSFILFFAYLLF